MLEDNATAFSSSLLKRTERGGSSLQNSSLTRNLNKTTKKEFIKNFFDRKGKSSLRRNEKDRLCREVNKRKGNDRSEETIKKSENKLIEETKKQTKIQSIFWASKANVLESSKATERVLASNSCQKQILNGENNIQNDAISDNKEVIIGKRNICGGHFSQINNIKNNTKSNNVNTDNNEKGNSLKRLNDFNRSEQRKNKFKKTNTKRMECFMTTATTTSTTTKMA